MIVLKNGRIWDGKKFIYGDVVIENGMISQVGKSSGDTKGYEIDASGTIISAGLVDIHTHIRNISCDELGVQGESCCFPFGVTAVADASCIAENQELLKTFLLKNVVFVSVDICDNKVDFTCAERIMKHANNVVGIKVYFDKEISEVKDIKPLKEICNYAHHKGLKVMVHCTNSPVSMCELLKYLKKGDICTHAYHGVGHTVTEDNFASLRQAKDKGVIIDTAAAGGVHMDFSIMKKAVEEGVLPNTISTDITRKSSYIRGGRYGMTLAMSIMRTLGMQECDILKAVTSTPAKALNKQDLWGEVRVGTNADIAVLKYTNHMFDFTDRAGHNLKSDKAYICLLTISDGQIVYRSENYINILK